MRNFPNFGQNDAQIVHRALLIQILYIFKQGNLVSK